MTEGHTLTTHNLAGYKIPYFDLDGKETDFYRVRFLEYKPSINKFCKSEPTVDPPEKERIRYRQPANTPVEAYFPPLPNKKMSWRKIAEDPKQPIIITEGEKKAAAITLLCDLPTIGLGGVDSWQSKKLGIEFLPVFDEEFNWTERPTYLAWDSDRHNAKKPGIQLALSRLTAQVVKRKGHVFIVDIPEPEDGTKIALDDYLAEFGEEDVKQLIESAVEDSSSYQLHELNTEVAFVNDPCAIIRLETGKLLTRENFTNLAYAPRTYIEMPSGKIKSTAKEWLVWPHRLEVSELVYTPGEPKLTNNKFNQWKGWGCEPSKGDIKPWLWLVDLLLQEKPQEEKEYLIQWLAYPLQHPGTKLLSALLMIGPPGIGKNLLGETMKYIYGADNFALIGNEDLKDNYNDWAVKKQFILGDEILISRDRYNMVDAVKSMITRTQVRIREKYEPSYTIQDCANYMFISNNDIPIHLEPRERRYFVQRIRSLPAEAKKYAEYDKWQKGDGPAALFRYLLDVDCSKFKPNAHAMETADYHDLIEASRSDLDAFAYAVKNDPEAVGLTMKLYTAKMLLEKFDPQERTKVTERSLKRALTRAGLAPVDGTNNTRDVAGNRVWLYALNGLGGIKSSEATKLFIEQQNGNSKKFAGKVSSIR